MKIKPENLLNNRGGIYYKKILITGSDESLMSYVKDFVISNFKTRNFFIDFSGDHDSGVVGNLFSEKKTLFLLSDFPVNKNSFDIKKPKDHYALIFSPNGKKTNAIKAEFTKLKEALVVECYTLNRKSKEFVLSCFIKDNNMLLSSDVFYYIIDSFENNYVPFIRQLQTLALFNNKIDLVSDVDKIIFVENKIELNKIFFNIFKNNKLLTSAFNKSINSTSDFYIFLNSTKLYLEIIRGSSDKEAALARFPRYLFVEKDIFLKIYCQLSKDKLLKIYKSLLKVELLVRKHSDLYLVIGLRFFLNLKKIIIS